MDNEIKVEIYRNLDNRRENLPDDSPRAIQLHRRRAAALHEIFDSAPDGIKVKNWGNTDSPKSHEVVELLLVLSQPAVVHAVGAATLAAAKLLGAAAIGESVKEGVKKNGPSSDCAKNRRRMTLKASP